MKKIIVKTKVQLPPVTKGDAILVHPVTPPPPPAQPAKSSSPNKGKSSGNGKK